MPHRTFLAFMLPSLVAMLLFIALPIVSVAYQSLFVEHERVMVEVENCGPSAAAPRKRASTPRRRKSCARKQPLGRFNGLGTYVNRNHLAFDEVGAISRDNAGFSDALSQIYNLPFYKALAFTLAYTFIVTPLAMLLGFCIALGVNAIPPISRVR